MINTHDVEFSIAWGVEEIVCDPNPMPFFFNFYLFIHVLCINQLLGTKSTCNASYGKENISSPVFYYPP